MSLHYLNNTVSPTECIGNSLSTINIGFSSLDTGLYNLSSYTVAAVNYLSATMISVSADLHTEIVTASSNLQTEINFLSASIPARQFVVNPNAITFTTQTLSAIPGLSFNLAPNKHYEYVFTVDYINSNNAEGLSVSLSGESSPVALKFYGILNHGDVSGDIVNSGVGNQYGQKITSSTGSTTITGLAGVRGYIFNGNTTNTLYLVGATSTGAGGNTTTVYASGYGVLNEIF